MFEITENLTEYTVCADGIIKNISGNWDSFAIDNDAGTLFSESVIGTNLFSHISGDSVKHIYQILHERILHNPGRPVTFTHRCDSPELRRSMTMIIVARGTDIVYRSMIVNTRPHQRMMKIDYTAETDSVITMCSWCKSYQRPQDAIKWMAFETLFENIPEYVSISHGICPDCRDRIESEYKRSVWQQSSVH